MLAQPKWNDALLEMFRNEYIGTAPYISCSPSLRHHRLCPGDQFLVLSSDGLYQYLTNEEVVSHVENFMEKFPEGDPAQHLIEELLFRAAKKAGILFRIVWLFPKFACWCFYILLVVFGIVIEDLFGPSYPSSLVMLNICDVRDSPSIFRFVLSGVVNTNCIYSLFTQFFSDFHAPSFLCINESGQCCTWRILFTCDALVLTGYPILNLIWFSM